MEEQKSGLQIQELLSMYPVHKTETLKSIKTLYKTNQITVKEGFIELNESGKKEAKRIVRLHRLWELYLNEYMNIAPDHVHDSAEKLEHLITPELEELLDNRLNYPMLDPHQENIPRDHDDH
jgi:manganese/zinc/iron transport system permease protein